MWYAVCVPDPEDASKNFVIGYDNSRHPSGYGYAENLIFDFYKTDEYKELKAEYPHITCHTRSRSDSRLWRNLIGQRPDEVWAICEVSGFPPTKVLSGLIHRELRRLERDAEEDKEEGYDGDDDDDDDDSLLNRYTWLYEKNAVKCAADVLSQAMWAWYGFSEDERRRAIALDREFEVFKTYFNHRMMNADITASYLFTGLPAKRYVGFVEKSEAGKHE